MLRTLETERLILRKWEETDLDDLYEYASNPNIGPNAGWKPHENKNESRLILMSFIQGDEIYAIVEKRMNKVIGSIGIHGDPKRNNKNARMIGYVLNEVFWGRGLVVEGVLEVLRYLYEELFLDIVSVIHYPENLQSKRVIEKCGFIYEGTIRQGGPIYDGTLRDDVCYSMTRKEWQEKILKKDL